MTSTIVNMNMHNVSLDLSIIPVEAKLSTKPTFPDVSRENVPLPVPTDSGDIRNSSALSKASPLLPEGLHEGLEYGGLRDPVVDSRVSIRGSPLIMAEVPFLVFSWEFSAFNFAFCDCK